MVDRQIMVEFFSNQDTTSDQRLQQTRRRPVGWLSTCPPIGEWLHRAFITVSFPTLVAPFLSQVQLVWDDHARKNASYFNESPAEAGAWLMESVFDLDHLLLRLNAVASLNPPIKPHMNTWWVEMTPKGTSPAYPRDVLVVTNWAAGQVILPK